MPVWSAAILRSSTVAEELDVQAWTEAEASGKADRGNPRSAGGQFGGGHALRHEQDVLGRNGSKVGKERVDFGEVLRTIHDELELIVLRLHQLANDVEAKAGAVMSLGAPPRVAMERGGVAQLGADAGEVADHVAVYGGGGLDGEMVAGVDETASQVLHALGDERFAAGEHDMRGGERADSSEDLGRRKLVAFRIPRGVGRVAPDAAKVAAAGADKGAGQAGELSLTLNAVEDLGDAHGIG